MPNLSNVVKSIQNIMRQDAGVDGDAQRISQLGWMLFLKVFDDREKEYELIDENYKSPIPSELQWRNWAENEEGITGDELLEFVNNNLFKKLKDLDVLSNKRAPIVKGVFEDSYNYMKNGTLLRQVINKLNEIDFNISDDRHHFNEIYEKILKDLQSAGNAGEFYTPRALTKFMVEMLEPKLGEIVFDPACGTGGFLTNAIDYLINTNQVKNIEDREILQNTIRGFEKKPLPHLLCTTNMILHDIEVPQIKHDNSLSRPLKDYTHKDRVDIIFANPPFGGIEEEGIDANFPASYRTKETADLFLLLFIHLLKDNGNAAIILPDGSLTGEGVKQRIRQKLLEECNLHTIVRLPNSVFQPYATVATNMLFFKKGNPTKEIWYWQHQLPEGQKSYNKTNPIRFEEFDNLRDWWKDKKENGQAWKVNIETIIERGYDLDIKNPTKPEEAHEYSSAELLQMFEKSIEKSNNLLKKLIEEVK